MTIDPSSAQPNHPQPEPRPELSRPGSATDGSGTDERNARAIWSALADPTDLDAYALVATHGPIGALEHVNAGHGPVRWQQRLTDLHPEDLRPRQDVARLLVPGDDEWPAAVDDLGIHAPFCLWARGPLDLPRMIGRAVAITGARASTPYGEQVAADLGRGAAAAGITVISGAAYGIDGAAHRGCLGAGGPAIAVLAGGIEHSYPAGHRETDRPDRPDRAPAQRGPSPSGIHPQPARRSRPPARSPQRGDRRGRSRHPLQRPVHRHPRRTPRTTRRRRTGPRHLASLGRAPPPPAQRRGLHHRRR